MTDEMTTEQYQEKIAELEKQLEQAKKENNFDELKNKYEKIIEEKNQEIKNRRTQKENNTNR